MLTLAVSFILVQLAGSTWSQVGQSFTEIQHTLGYSIAIAEGTHLTLALGGLTHSQNHRNQGIVRTYHFDDLRCLWSPLGNDIVGLGPEDAYGTSLDLSCDGSMVAVGADTTRDVGGVRAGSIQVYQYEAAGARWNQLGLRIAGRNQFTNFGFKLKLSCDGTTLAAAAIGYVQVFEYINRSWAQKGQTLEGAGQMLTALSADGTIVAAAETQPSCPSSPTTCVPRALRVYRFSDSAWSQLGQPVTLDVPDVPFPYMLAMSDAGTRVVAGANGWSGTAQHNYGVLVFDYVGDVGSNHGDWAQAGADFGPTSGSWGMESEDVAMSGDGSFVLRSIFKFRQSQPSIRYRGSVWARAGGEKWRTVGEEHPLPGDEGHYHAVAVSRSGDFVVFGTSGVGKLDGELLGEAQVLHSPVSRRSGCTPTEPTPHPSPTLPPSPTPMPTPSALHSATLAGPSPLLDRVSSSPTPTGSPPSSPTPEPVPSPDCSGEWPVRTDEEISVMGSNNTVYVVKGSNAFRSCVLWFGMVSPCEGRWSVCHMRDCRKDTQHCTPVLGSSGIPLQTAARLHLHISYTGPKDAGDRSHCSVALTGTVLSTPSLFLCSLVGVGMLGLGVCVAGLVSARLRQHAPCPAPALRRLALLRKGAICMAVWSLATGVFWCLSSHPQAYSLGYVNGGLGLTVVGVLLLVLSALGTLYDRVPYACPVCGARVSGWLFFGAYLPPLRTGQSLTLCKVHTHHLRCLFCKKAFPYVFQWWGAACHGVVSDLWGACPVARPYHVGCWAQHCLQFAADAQYQAHWAEQEGPVASDAELAHMLAAVVQEWDLPSIERLMSLRSGLHTIAIADLGGLTAVRLAARLGRHLLLDHLLRHERIVLPQHCAIDDAAGHSLVVQGLDPDSDDLYICEPAVSYNGRHVYFGGSHGKYIYYYTPQPEDKRQYTSGWCLSRHLGTGKPPLRLLLPERPKAAVRATQGTGRFLWEAMTRCFRRRSEPHDPRIAGPDPVDGVRYLAADAIGLRWVPHSATLLHDAVMSGSEATTRYIIRMFRQLHPHAVVRRHYTEHGLWEQDWSPPEVRDWLQAEVRDWLQAEVRDWLQAEENVVQMQNFGEIRRV